MAVEIGYNEKVRKEYDKKIEEQRLKAEKEKLKLLEQMLQELNEAERKRSAFHKGECKHCGAIFEYSESEEIEGEWKQCTFEGGYDCNVYVTCPHCGEYVKVDCKDKYC